MNSAVGKTSTPLSSNSARGDRRRIPLTLRSAAKVNNERFRECVALQAQYKYNTFGKFPGMVPSMLWFMYHQVHHLDLDFYDEFYKPIAHLKTHAEHLRQWHSEI